MECSKYGDKPLDLLLTEPSLELQGFEEHGLRNTDTDDFIKIKYFVNILITVKVRLLLIEKVDNF